MRVLLVGMSNLLSNIVMGALAQAPDLVVVGQVDAFHDLASELRLTPVDAVIVQTSRPGAATTFVELLHNFPLLNIVTIDPSGKSGFLHQLRPYSTRIAEVSIDGLVSALRMPAAPVRRTKTLVASQKSGPGR